MSRSKSADSPEQPPVTPMPPVPTLGELLFAIADIGEAEKKRIIEMHERLRLDPAAFETWADRFISAQLGPAALARIATRIKADLFALVTTNSGPVSHDPVDLA